MKHCNPLTPWLHMINSSWLAEFLGGNVHAESEEIVSCHGSLGKGIGIRKTRSFRPQSAELGWLPIRNWGLFLDILMFNILWVWFQFIDLINILCIIPMRIWCNLYWPWFYRSYLQKTCIFGLFVQGFLWWWIDQHRGVCEAGSIPKASVLD